MTDVTGTSGPARRATLRDVAALAKVDASLVSRVINDDPKAGAAPQTRQRIIDAVRQLDYRPNVAARGLRMARTWTIGVLVPSVTNPMYADVIAGAEAGPRSSATASSSAPTSRASARRSSPACCSKVASTG